MIGTIIYTFDVGRIHRIERIETGCNYVRIKGELTRIQAPTKDDAPASVSLIFGVDRSSQWNGIALHGFVSASFQSRRAPEEDEHLIPGREVAMTCQVGMASMPGARSVQPLTGGGKA